MLQTITPIKNNETTNLSYPHYFKIIYHLPTYNSYYDTRGPALSCSHRTIRNELPSMHMLPTEMAGSFLRRYSKAALVFQAIAL